MLQAWLRRDSRPGRLRPALFAGAGCRISNRSSEELEAAVLRPFGLKSRRSRAGISPNARSLSAVCEPPHEIAEAFFANSRSLDAGERAWLGARGISDTAIESDPYCASGPVRRATVVFGQYFNFVTEDEGDAAPAFVVICRGWDGVTADIAAFDETRFALWLGQAPVLGEQLVLAWRLGEPLRVFEDVWAWLRGDRDGVVPVDWRRTASLLENTPLAVDAVAFGQLLRERLTRPPPPIFVKSTERPPHDRGRLRNPRTSRAQAVPRRGPGAQRAEGGR
jgi:hypothetical protein